MALREEMWAGDGDVSLHHRWRRGRQQPGGDVPQWEAGEGRGSKGQEEEEQTLQTEEEPPERWPDHWQDP